MAEEIQATRGVIHLCLHCSERCGGMYCKNCGTKEQRLLMCKEN